MTAGLGGLAAVVLAALAILLYRRPTEVGLLMEVLTDPDLPDAAWAFEELKEVSDEDLWDLLDHLTDESSKPLHNLDWHGPGASGSTSNRETAFQVRQVARFVLLCRVGMLGEATDWDLYRPLRSRGEWEADLKRFELTHATPNGAPIPPRP